MGRIVFTACLLSQLFFWDMRLKLTKIASTKRVKRYITNNISRMARKLFGFARQYVGLRLSVDRGGVPDIPKRFVIVSNHQSLIDIAAILAAFPDRRLRFVAKRQLAYGFPAVSPILRYERHALIDRGKNFAASMRAIKRLARPADLDICPVVFAEGTRSRDGVVRKFRAGAVRTIASERSLPIVGVAVDGGYRLSTMGDLARNAGRTVYRVATVGVAQPPKDKRQMETVLAQMQQLIESRIDAWRRSVASSVAQG